jgi:hypothetical protein
VTPNLAKVCRFAKCSYSLAKRVQQDLLLDGYPSPFEVQNQKDPQLVAELDSSISRVQGSYTTIGDLKRLHPTFSRKWIAMRLHRTGLRYHKMARKRKVERKELYRKKEVIAVISHLAQALINSETVDTFYIDEVHFPLYQTSDKHWTDPNLQDNALVYNRRPANSGKISAIALCSLKGFEAVQFFTNDVRSEDFLYFLQESLPRVSTKKKVTILADNAAWHTAKSISSTRACKFLHMNAPKLFQANAIENCFSFVRCAFRKRPLVETYEEEVRLLLGIFFDSQNSRRMEGIERNHIRSLLKLLHFNYMGAVVDDSSESSNNDG